jgi:hypothetical protein
MPIQKPRRPPVARIASPNHTRLEPGFTASHVEKILLDAKITLGEVAEAWAARLNSISYLDKETGEFRYHNRNSLEWLAHYLTDAGSVLPFHWHIQQVEKPSAREAWAREVEMRALDLLQALGINGTDAPFDLPAGALEALAAHHDAHEEWYAPDTAFLRRMQPDFVETSGDPVFDHLDALLLQITKGRDPRPDVPGYPAHMIAQKNPPPILIDAMRIAAVGVQLLARRADATVRAARAQMTGKKTPDTAFLNFAGHIVTLFREALGQEPTVRTDSNPVDNRHRRRWSPALAFYQGAAQQLLDLLPPSTDPGLRTELKQRVSSAEVAAGDIEDAKRGSRRKR